MQGLSDDELALRVGANGRPSFHGIKLKLHRARAHLDQLTEEWDGLSSSDAYRYERVVSDGGKEHVLRVVETPEQLDRFSLQAGDCVHNMRSALDHLAWQLVLLNGGTPDRDTAFLIQDPNQGTLRFTRGISSEAKAQLKAFLSGTEPYVDCRSMLWDLHQFDIWDKHCVLVVVASIVRQAVVKHDLADGWYDEEPVVEFMDTPISRGADVLRIRFDRPVAEDRVGIDPRAHLVVGSGQPGDGRSLIPYLRDMLMVVGDITEAFRLPLLMG